MRLELKLSRSQSSIHCEPCPRHLRSVLVERDGQLGFFHSSYSVYASTKLYASLSHVPVI